MNVKDLEIAKELSHEERAVVRGGSNTMVGFNSQPQSVVSNGFQFASPDINVGGPQINTQTYTPTTTIVNLSSLSAVGSELYGVAALAGK